MSVTQIVPSVYKIPLGMVNAFLIDTGDLTLIDTGVADSANDILDAVREIGRRPSDVDRIVVTHCHADHTGSLAKLKGATGAPAYMHADDAALVREGQADRPMEPAPGLIPRLITKVLMRGGPMTTQPADIEYEVADGDELDVAGGLRAVHVPGHCAGQLAFLWPRHGGVLFVADAASNMFGRLGWSIVYEDFEAGKRSLVKLADMAFEVACFGHGRTMTRGASGRFRQKWQS
jgi:glyoxylase-like metal-dependent hydrolase (beta-lactamase superfamily II)